MRESNVRSRAVGAVRKETKSPGEGEVHPWQTQRSPRTLSPDIQWPLPLGRKAVRHFGFGLSGREKGETDKDIESENNEVKQKSGNAE